MGEVTVVVASETTEVSDDTLSRLHAVVMERPTLPLCKAERHFELDVLKITGGESGRALHTIEVVIESRSLGNKERARYTLEVHVSLELVFEGLLDQAERLLLGKEVLEDRLIRVQDLLGRETGKGIFRVESSGHGRDTKLKVKCIGFQYLSYNIL